MVKLPSKNSALILGACALAIGGIAFVALYPTKKTKTTDPLAALSSVKGSAVENALKETDTDADGLKDWEEALWDSNPRVKDSDNDGTMDGAEVQAGRNPMVKGPNDVVKTAPVVETTASAAVTPKSASTTVTSTVAKQLFAEYAALKQSGKEITPEMEDQLIASTLTTSNLGSFEARVYTYKDIKVSSDMSNIALRAYANSIGTIFDKNGTKDTDNELTIITTVSQSKDPIVLAKLDMLIDSYKRILTQVLALPVPEVVASSHLDLINGFSAGIDADERMKHLLDDPAIALAGLKEYENASVLIGTSIRDMATYYHNQSLMFDRKEPAAAFFNIVAN